MKTEIPDAFSFSPHGVKSIDAYKVCYSEFIEYCINRFNGGTFSSFCDNEPVLLSCGFSFSLTQFEKWKEADK
jgi:hypothetical protein